jgi:hypothetical protein
MNFALISKGPIRVVNATSLSSSGRGTRSLAKKKSGDEREEREREQDAEPGDDLDEKRLHGPSFSSAQN